MDFEAVEEISTLKSREKRKKWGQPRQRRTFLAWKDVTKIEGDGICGEEYTNQSSLMVCIQRSLNFNPVDAVRYKRNDRQTVQEGIGAGGNFPKL